MTDPAVRYGDESVPLALPDGVETRLAVPRPVAPASDPLAAVAEALDHPHGAPPLDEVARGCGRVTLVVPDATRPSRADVYLLPVVARLARAGLLPGQLTVVVARGIHAASTRADVVRILGATVMDAFRAVQSAPDTPDLNQTIAQDEEVGEVRVHRLVAEADLVVLTGAVVPHHLTGFGGGPKALVPGTAQRETVLAAHRLTLRSSVRPDGEVRSLAGQTGPQAFSEALLRIARAFGRTWLLNVILADDGQIAAAAAGEVGEAHAAAIESWQALRGQPEAVPSDLVVVGAAAPRDRDLVQAHKALLAALPHAKPGAPIVWAARAPAGAGPTDFLRYFEIRKAKDHLAALRREFHPYGLTAYSIRKIAEAHPVHVVSEVSKALLRPMGLLPHRSIEKAILYACEHHDVETCAVLPSPVA